MCLICRIEILLVLSVASLIYHIFFKVTATRTTSMLKRVSIFCCGVQPLQKGHLLKLNTQFAHMSVSIVSFVTCLSCSNLTICPAGSSQSVPPFLSFTNLISRTYSWSTTHLTLNQAHIEVVTSMSVKWRRQVMFVTVICYRDLGLNPPYSFEVWWSTDYKYSVWCTTY